MNNIYNNDNFGRVHIWESLYNNIDITLLKCWILLIIYSKLNWKIINAINKIKE